MTSAAAAGLCAPLIRASNKSGLGPVIVGEGEFTYEVEHDWARVPTTHAFGNTHGVAVDSQGLIHIKHTVHQSSGSGDAICVFDPGGAFVRSWGADFRGGAHGLSLVREGGDEFLFVCDCNRGVVQKTTLTGEVVLDFRWPESSGLYNSKAEYKPTNVAVVPLGLTGLDGKPCSQAGHIYIADGYGKSWIHEHSAAGEYIASFGGPGAERGQVSCPHGIGIDTRQPTPRIVVADRGNRRLQYFTLEGRHLGFTTEGLRMPCHFDQRGPVLLVPDLEARVTLLGEGDRVLAQLGDGINFSLRDRPRDQFVAGKFIAPHNACFDAAGNIFVVEWVEVGRVTRLRKVG